MEVSHVMSPVNSTVAPQAKEQHISCDQSCSSEVSTENMDGEVRRQHTGEEMNCDSAEDTVNSEDDDSSSDTDDSSTDDDSSYTDDKHSPKYSSYPNGATRLSSHNCEQGLHTMETKVCNGRPLTPQQVADGLPAESLAPSNDVTCSAADDANNTSLATENTASNSSGSDDHIVSVHTAEDKAAETPDCADVKVNGCAEKSVASTVVQVDSARPVDFSGSNRTAVSTTTKPPERNVTNDVQKMNTVKHDTIKHDVKLDSFRPVGRLVHDLGLELVREQVYRDLIDIQTVKDANNRLEEREKGQLLKLIEAQERLALRNAPYTLPTKRCSRCNFMSPSGNVMTWHHQFGTVSRVDATMHVCCLCSGRVGFRTRHAGQFVEHIFASHGLHGQLMKKPAAYECRNCVFEHRNSVRYVAHVEKCLKRFSLNTNLQPLPGDCDIPLIYRPSDRKRPVMSPFTQSNAGGPPSVKTLLSSLRQQTPPGNSGNQLVMTSLICEICGKLVDGREALWGHFRSAHHVELCRTTMRENEPWMKCDVCSGRFWTYQGLSRHLLLAHNRALATSFTSPTPVTPTVARCHLCGGSQTSNPLSHFSAYHNVTLLEMYHAKLCCLCNRKVNSGRAFEEHMVERHSDIFANYDVLRTVLQALTAARYFKAGDTREPTTQHFTQLSSRSGPGTDAASDVRKKSADGANLASESAQARNNADGKPVMGTPGSSQTLQRKQNTSGGVNAQGEQKMHITNDFVMKLKKPRKKRLSAPEEQLSPVKPVKKEATVEEVKKLYEDLAGIGRPILRSMRHKVRTNSDVRSEEQTESSSCSVSEQTDSIDSVETPTKKLHLESSEQMCVDKTDNAI